MTEGGTVLLVEDDPTLRLSLAECLERKGYRVIEAFSHDDALHKLDMNLDIGCVVTDVAMPGRGSGVELAKEVRGNWPSIATIVLSGSPRSALLDLPDGVDYLQKPCSEDKVLTLVSRYLRPSS
jgi:DNA-binding NtrC family response regulator